MYGWSPKVCAWEGSQVYCPVVIPCAARTAAGTMPPKSLYVQGPPVLSAVQGWPEGSETMWRAPDGSITPGAMAQYPAGMPLAVHQLAARASVVGWGKSPNPDNPSAPKFMP